MQRFPGQKRPFCATRAVKGSAEAVDEVSTADTKLLLLRDGLQREVKEKTELVRRLKMAKAYRTRNNPSQLRHLIIKWRSCIQEVLCELQVELQQETHRPDLSHLMEQFGIPHQLLHFNHSQEKFTEP